ncbi:hypothetical protein [Cryobacterium luteum]|uniref:Uncharacterized protein n=1 Tax=Cryobacterium luteum TaxID=1424661 RepID=A0A5F0D612_9MICO|nr:hypothetical protein [Cryobacterium luteum]TFB89903.1 hypothetical protein E3O10_09025 [Cryobacterium luteum]
MITAIRASSLTHFSTLRNDRTHRVLWPSILLSYVLPLLIGVATWLYGLRLSALGEIVGGLALMAGFLFALVIFVFELRLRVTNDPRVQTAIQLPRLIDELFANVTYSVVIALAATGLALIAATNEPQTMFGVHLGVEPWLSGCLVALMVHLFAMILTCLRRTGAAYRELRS